eukprot:CAMPEP_0204902084 /NCGR_PEP_ID=MMETSP1397-20131031/3458_1 /ASSEMBLY_ACC=CAM_ASM_000891 /TAXON_ID=49980 /ORGANISM="Climacostomum Climacostomum virens, Strain Stock W-24" /LENGTH=574 /DNA_ID=CAMNT_0052070531 /DNA_START=162 /DNA_END=1887 /DNA_ORIENTATION=+
MFVNRSQYKRRNAVVRVRKDFSNVQSKVTTFRDKEEAYTEDIAQHKIRNTQQKLRNEMMMKNDHHLLRTMKRELKKKTEAEQASIQETQDFCKFYDKLSTNSPIENEDDYDTRQHNREDLHRLEKAALLESQLAFRKSIEYDSKAWRQKRGMDSSSMPTQVTDFIHALYDVLDSHKFKDVTGGSLLSAFVALGICDDPQVLKLTLINIYKVKKFDSLRVTKESLEALCKPDLRTDTILAVLNKFAINERGKSTQSAYGSPPRFISPQPSIRIDLTFETTRSMENFVFMKPSEIPVSISEQQVVVKRWWREINLMNNDSIEVSSVIDKLVDVGISSDINEARKVIVKLIGVRKKMEYAEFLQLFVRSMMKGALQTLALKVSGLFCDLEPSDKIVAYKRALLLTGLKYYKYEINPREGYRALKGLKKLKGAKMISKLTDEDYQRLAAKFRELCGIVYKPEVVRRHNRHFSLPIKMIETTESPEEDDDYVIDLNFAKTPKSNKEEEQQNELRKLEEMAAQEIVTRVEFDQIRHERPDLKIKAKFVISEVKPLSRKRTSASIQDEIQDKPRVISQEAV